MRRFQGLPALSSAVSTRTVFPLTVTLRLGLCLGGLGLAMAAVAGCGGGGGGGGSAGEITYSDAFLEDVIFVDPEGRLHQPTGSGPTNASLVQRVCLVFSDPFDLGQVHPSAVHMRDTLTGEIIAGTFQKRAENRLYFTPDLPTAAPQQVGSFWDLPGFGLRPGREYEFVVVAGPPDALPFLAGIRGTLLKRYGFRLGDTLRIRFQTTTDPEDFWKGLPREVPDLLEVTPPDGATGVSPHLFTDPEQRVGEGVPFELVFDAPLDPDLSNVGPKTFRLIDQYDSQGRSAGWRLPVRVWISKNTLEESRVGVEPIGVLAPGHRLALGVPAGLRGLSDATTGASGTTIVSRFDVWRGEAPLSDAVVERFTTNALEETDAEELAFGQVPADWDIGDSDRLIASLSFPGQGELGRFIPVPLGGSGDHIVVLNTDVQELPIFDGSTPEVEFGTVVRGGVFNFSSIEIPDGVVVRGEGSNPLVLTATEGVTIRGVIDVSGQPGSVETTTDQSLSPLPGGKGGPGGGSGGDGHPAVYDGDPWLMNLVSPRRGLTGQGPDGDEAVGGKPGDSAINTAKKMNCGNGSGGGRAAGAGGGSFYTLGGPGRDGDGDVTSSEKRDAAGNQMYEPLPFGIPLHGEPGDPVFRDTNPENNLIGRRGEIKQTRGGQGGGGAGSRLDSYFCASTFPGLPSTVADARGGGGGGGGGGVEIRSLGEIVLEGSGFAIQAQGGDGGGGEPVGKCNRGGGGGGGAGGAVRLISVTPIRFETGVPNDSFVVTGGDGPGGNSSSYGGPGGHGLVQFEIPADNPDFPQRFPPGIAKPDSSIVDPEKTPADLTSVSTGQSVWINLGPGVFRDGQGQADFSFRGTDEDGYVMVDNAGYLVDAGLSDIRVDSLPVLDPFTGRIVIPGRTDYIPDNASVRILFQAARARSDDSGEVDPSTVTAWSPSIDVADGHQFLRFRVILDIARGGYSGHKLTPELPRVAVRLTRLRFTF
ncbi:MAG: hypothetical protein AB1486_10110 [Planctomycetota bacterium]